MRISIANTHTARPMIIVDDNNRNKDIEIPLHEMSIDQLTELSSGLANLICSVNSQISHKNMTKS